MYIVTYEPEAENDLFEIVFYYAEQGGFELAETINNRIRDHIKRLETMPFRRVFKILCQRLFRFPLYHRVYPRSESTTEKSFSPN